VATGGLSPGRAGGAEAVPRGQRLRGGVCQNCVPPAAPPPAPRPREAGPGRGGRAGGAPGIPHAHGGRNRDEAGARAPVGVELPRRLGGDRARGRRCGRKAGRASGLAARSTSPLPTPSGRAIVRRALRDSGGRA